MRGRPSQKGGLVVYHRLVMPERERLLQLARLLGGDAFVERFGQPQTAAPDPEALRELIDGRLNEIARALVEEAASSDDVTDVASAASFLEDRLETLGGLLSEGQAEALRELFSDKTVGW